MSFRWGEFSERAIESIAGSTARLNIWEGAVRSGKTIASLAAFLGFAASGPDGPLLIAGKTEATVRRNVIEPLREMLGEKYFLAKPAQGEGTLFGHKVYFVGASDARSEGKLRGMTLAGAYGDELTLWPREFFQMLLTRLSLEGARLYATTNPDSGAHWLLTDYLNNDRLDLKRWHFTLDDNPNLPGEYRKALREEYSGMWYRRFILGEWCAAQGVVYDMFDPERLVRETTERDAGGRCLIACDYGIHNPCVFGLFLENGGEYHLAEEYYHCGRESGQKTDAEYAAALEKFAAGRTRTVIIDPSASSLIVQLRRLGYSVIPAKNAVLDGIREVGLLLSEGRLTIAPGCRNTLREFSCYVWDENAGGDEPVKDNDHCMDMLRYAVFTDRFLRGQERKSYSGRNRI